MVRGSLTPLKWDETNKRFSIAGIDYLSDLKENISSICLSMPYSMWDEWHMKEWRELLPMLEQDGNVELHMKMRNPISGSVLSFKAAKRIEITRKLIDLLKSLNIKFEIE